MGQGELQYQVTELQWNETGSLRPFALNPSPYFGWREKCYPQRFSASSANCISIPQGSRPNSRHFRAPMSAFAASCVHRPALLGFFLRHALESAWLAEHGAPPALAALAAARAAAQFIEAEAEALTPTDRAALPAWVAMMAADVAPSPASLTRHFAANPSEIAHIRAIWSQLGTADALMETGGDIRLARDPRSALNGYGCSHRPRPWAVTFASSTASSSSERGFEAADRARLHTTLALLRGTPRRDAIRASLDAVREGLAAPSTSRNRPKSSSPPQARTPNCWPWP